MRRRNGLRIAAQPGAAAEDNDGEQVLESCYRLRCPLTWKRATNRPKIRELEEVVGQYVVYARLFQRYQPGRNFVPCCA